jgi:hypothetical protein
MLNESYEVFYTLITIFEPLDIYFALVFILRNRILELAEQTELMTYVFSWQISWFLLESGKNR